MRSVRLESTSISRDCNHEGNDQIHSNVAENSDFHGQSKSRFWDKKKIGNLSKICTI